MIEQGESQRTLEFEKMYGRVTSMVFLILAVGLISSTSFLLYSMIKHFKESMKN